MVRVTPVKQFGPADGLVPEQLSLKRELHTHCSGEMVPCEAAIMSTTVETFTLEVDVKDLKRFEVEAAHL